MNEMSRQRPDVSCRSDNSTCLENLAVGKRGRLVVYADMTMRHKMGCIPNAEGMIEYIRAVEWV